MTSKDDSKERRLAAIRRIQKASPEAAADLAAFARVLGAKATVEGLEAFADALERPREG